MTFPEKWVGFRDYGQMCYSTGFTLLGGINIEIWRGWIFNVRELFLEPTERLLALCPMLIWSRACVICKMPYFVFFFSDLLISKMSKCSTSWNGAWEESRGGLTATCDSWAVISFFSTSQWLNLTGTWLCLGHLLWHLIHPQLPVAFFGSMFWISLLS